MRYLALFILGEVILVHGTFVGVRGEEFWMEFVGQNPIAGKIRSVRLASES
jgi:hypothetical protein